MVRNEYHVHERPVMLVPLFGAEDPEYTTDYKVLYRLAAYTRDGVFGRHAVPLACVKKSYKVIQNIDLYAAVDEALKKLLTDVEYKSITTKDTVSHWGKTAYRDYHVPAVNFKGTGDKDVCLRIIVQNSFGDKAIRIYTGGIDFWCSNGMIIGDYSMISAKHTSKVNIADISKQLERAVKDFYTLQERVIVFKNTFTQCVDDTLSKYLIDSGIPKSATKLIIKQLNYVELNDRYATAWAVYSAMTAWASNNIAGDVLRDTGSDHRADTLLKREQLVAKIASSTKFLQVLKGELTYD